MKTKFTHYFTRLERLLLFSSLILILLSFFLFDRENYMTLVASILGVCSLILGAKGNPLGPLLMIVFSILYAVISFTFAYYGEMITYLGMSAPMAAFSLFVWLKNPYNGNKSEVRAARLRHTDLFRMLLYSALVTVGFYFVLQWLGTANLIPSTVSVTTSFAAAYLTYRRSPYFALAYALNDLILIVLWVLAAIEDISYVSVIICFVVFLINDLYGFVNWKKMQRRQEGA